MKKEESEKPVEVKASVGQILVALRNHSEQLKLGTKLERNKFDASLGRFSRTFERLAFSLGVF